MAASVLKVGVNLGTSQWLGQTLRQTVDSQQQIKAHRVSLPIRAGSYSDELVKTALRYSAEGESAEANKGMFVKGYTY